MSVSRQTFLLVIIIIAAAVIRFSYLTELQQNPLPLYTSTTKNFDQFNFLRLTYDLIDNHWVGPQLTENSPERHHMSVAYAYPIALIFTIFGEKLNYVFIFQILLGILSVYIIYKSAEALFENKTVGLIAAALTAFYGPFIFYEGALLRASLIANVNLLGFYFLINAVKSNSGRQFLFAGIFVGISTALRINALSLLIVPYLLLQRKWTVGERVLQCVIFILGMVIIISPLSARNKFIGHNAAVSSYGPATFWFGNTHDSKGFGTPISPLREQLSAEAKGDAGQTLQIFIREIKKYPKDYADLYWRKVTMFFNGYETPGNLNYDLAKEQSSILRFNFLDFRVICPLALLGLFLVFGKSRQIGLLYLFIFVLSASIILFHVQSRYRLPGVPFFIILASYTIYWFYQKFQQRCFSSVILALGTVCLGLFLTKPNDALIHQYLGGRVRGLDYSNLANAYLQKYENTPGTEESKMGILREALKYRQKSIPLAAPSDKPNYVFNFGLINLYLDNFEEAKNAFETVLTLQPDHQWAKIHLEGVKGLINNVQE